MSTAPKGKAIGGAARAASLTPERRKEIAISAAKAQETKKHLPVATHGSTENPLKIGDLEIPCYVLHDGRRVLTMRGLQQSLGFSTGGGKDGARKIPAFLQKLEEKGLQINDLSARANQPFDFLLPDGKKVATAYEATLLVDICDALLSARSQGILANDSPYAHQCEVLVRGFARVGIVALVDEATGYQRDRAKDALAKILEAFVAKEIQPYLKTFPADYYENLFRLYKLPFPPEGNKSWRPAFFGHITNEVVYSRLAPDLLPELKKAASKAEKKAKLHQWLTTEIGHPKLKEHLSSIVTIMKLSATPEQFKANVNMVHPRHGDTKQFDFNDTSA